MAINEIEKNKKYEVRVYYRDHLNRPRDIKRIVSGTFRDAQRTELDIFDSINDEVIYNPTFKELFDKYLESKQNNITSESLRKYKEIYSKFLSPLSRRKVNRMKPLVFLEWKNQLEAVDGSITQKNKAIYLLKSITKFGEEFMATPDNAKNITQFKRKVRDKFTYSTVSPGEFEYIISFEKKEVYKLMYEMYFWAGLRRGEGLALLKRDLLDSKELDVYQSVNNNKEVGPPKNESSYRRVKIHDDLFTRLLPHANSKGVYFARGHRTSRTHYCQ